MKKKFEDYLSENYAVSKEFFELFLEKFADQSEEYVFLEPFNNCREVGYVASAIMKQKKDVNSVLWATQSRNSDSILVILGSLDEKEFYGRYKEAPYRRLKTFGPDNMDEAVQYALDNFLKPKKSYDVLILKDEKRNVTYNVEGLKEASVFVLNHIDKRKIPSNEYCPAIISLNGDVIGIIHYNGIYEEWHGKDNPYIEDTPCKKKYLDYKVDGALSYEEKRILEELKGVFKELRVNKKELEKLLKNTKLQDAICSKILE